MAITSKACSIARRKYEKPAGARYPGSAPGQPASHNDKQNGATRSTARENARHAGKYIRRLGKRAVQEGLAEVDP